jgi:exonuclease III
VALQAAPPRDVGADIYSYPQAPCSILHLPGLDGLLPLSVATWNSASLFGALHSATCRASAKRSLHARLLAANSVVFAQETRGSSGDLAILGHTHRHFGTFKDVDEDLSTSRAGGVVTSVHIGIIGMAHTINEKVFAAGRCLAVRVSGAGFILLLINVHINPQWTFIQKKYVLRAVADYISTTPTAIVFFGGDFNFIHDDDRRLNSATGLEVEGSDPIAHTFESIFPVLVELAQPNYTRSCSLLAPTASLNYLSRIDRIYTNIPPAQLNDLTMQADTVGSILDSFRPSDHIPVVARISTPCRRSGPARIPHHIVSDPSFAKHLNTLQTDHLANLPTHEALEATKVLFREAAALARAELALGGHGPTKVRLAGTIACIRAARMNDPRALRKAVLMAPHIARHIDHRTYTIIDPVAIRDSLHELMETAICEDLRSLEGSSLPADRKKPKRDQLRQRQSLWRSCRRRANGLALCGPDGNPIVGPIEIGQHLTDHWSPIFAAKTIDHHSAARFLEHVQVVPLDFSWGISGETFANVLTSTGSSSPGPDGVPYGAWRHANQDCHEVLFRLLNDTLTNPNALPEQFNHSHLVFIPKGGDIGEDLVLGRTAHDLRPLNLSNTDNKLLALALNDRLSALCQITVASQQRGFVAGRHIEDNLFSLEAAAISLSATNLRRSAAILFDFCTAFPSLAHVWIFLVLSTMRIPDGFVTAIRQLYELCFAMLLFNGAELTSLLIGSGIKQGCPMSGSIFALVIDPLIRYLLHTSVMGSICITAFADDIAIVVANLFTMLPDILECFRRWAAASSLHLNSKKSVIIPLWIYDAAMIGRWLRVVAPDFAACRIASCAKYLGIMFGPGSDIVQWKPVEHKVLSRSAEACFVGFGFIDRIIHFKMHGTSTVMFKAQFADPTAGLLQAYRKAEQRLVAAPWMSIAPEVLHALVALGLPAGLADIQVLATAAKLRLVASSATFWETARSIDIALDSDDVLMVPPLRSWYSTGIIATLKRTWQTHHQMDGVASILRKPDSGNLQKRIYLALMHSSSIAKAKIVLRRRICYWKLSVTETNLTFATLCTVLASRLPSPLKMSILRTICNAWNTTSRFHQPLSACMFGCGAPADDRLLHYLCCPAVARQALRLLRLDSSLLAPSPLYALFALLATPDKRSAAALYIDATLFAFNAKRNGAVASAGHVFAARINDIRRRYPTSQLPYL